MYLNFSYQSHIKRQKMKNCKRFSIFFKRRFVDDIATSFGVILWAVPIS